MHVPFPDQDLFLTCVLKLRARAHHLQRFDCTAWVDSLEHLLSLYPRLARAPLLTAPSPMHLLSSKLEDMALIWKHSSAACIFDLYGATLWPPILQHLKDQCPIPQDSPALLYQTLNVFLSMHPSCAQSALDSFLLEFDHLTAPQASSLRNVLEPFESWLPQIKGPLLALLEKVALEPPPNGTDLPELQHLKINSL